MPERTPHDRGDRLIVWITPDRPLEPGISEAGDTWIERLRW